MDDSAGFVSCLEASGTTRMAAQDVDVGERTAIEIEADGIREAIRLNWLAMEYSCPSHVERLAIRANVALLVQTLMKLLGGLEQ